MTMDELDKLEKEIDEVYGRTIKTFRTIFTMIREEKIKLNQ